MGALVASLLETEELASHRGLWQQLTYQLDCPVGGHARQIFRLAGLFNPVVAVSFLAPFDPHYPPKPGYVA